MNNHSPDIGMNVFHGGRAIVKKDTGCNRKYLLLLLTFYNPLSAQGPVEALNKLATEHPSEKIYIHYDKDYYAAGETIWFKAYFYSNGLPSNLSLNFYLQLLDDKGEVVTRKQHPLQGATVKGSIELPDSLYEGYYFIRALTKAMLNSNSGTIYSKQVFVFNPARRPIKETASKDNSKGLSLRFFPESGDLVEGILTTIGFKAVDSEGYPVQVNGTIRVEGDTSVIPFRSLHDGMGRVQFRPKAGKKYVTVIDGHPEVNKFPLPEVRSSGINLSVENEKGGKVFLLSRSKNNKDRYDQLLLVGQINNIVVYENLIRFDDYLAVKGHLYTDDLPSGILQFIVFNKDGAPLAERLTFINNISETPADSIRVVKKNLVKRGENLFEITFPDSTPRSYSVAVTDYSDDIFPERENIYSRLLLTSDLNGHIFNPAWYFLSRSAQVSVALDNVMLTHGWSRFNWKKILANEFPKKKYTDSYLINITGTVFPEKERKPVYGGKLDVLLYTEDSSMYTYQVPVDSIGHFLIDSLIIVGKTKLFYTYLDGRGKTRPVDVIVDTTILEPGITEILSRLPLFPQSLLHPLNFYDSGISQRHVFIKEGNPEAKLLENVTIKTQKKRPVDIVNEKYTSEIFRTGGKVVVDNVNNKVVDRSMNGLDYVKNRITGVGLQDGTFINRRNFSLLNNTGGQASEGMKFWEVGLFINEMPATLLQLRILRADQIALVKFFQAGFVGSGSTYPGGAIAVYTKTSDDVVNDMKKTSKYVEYDGYSITREFYHPDYSGVTSSTSLDQRSTLYWNPDAGADNDTNIHKFSFYNNDISTKFKIVVEGFDARGRLVYIEKFVSDE